MTHDGCSDRQDALGTKSGYCTRVLNSSPYGVRPTTQPRRAATRAGRERPAAARWHGRLAPPITVIPVARPVPRWGSRPLPLRATPLHRWRHDSTAPRGMQGVAMQPRQSAGSRRTSSCPDTVASMAAAFGRVVRQGRGRHTMGGLSLGAAGEHPLRRLPPPLQPLPQASGGSRRWAVVAGEAGCTGRWVASPLRVRHWWPSGAGGGPRWTLNAISRWRRGGAGSQPDGLSGGAGGRGAGRRLVGAAQGKPGAARGAEAGLWQPGRAARQTRPLRVVGVPSCGTPAHGSAA
jgi:hypothetical protein